MLDNKDNKISENFKKLIEKNKSGGSLDDVNDIDDLDDDLEEEVDVDPEKKEFSLKLKKLLEDKDDRLKKVLKGEDPEITSRVVEAMDKWDKPKHKDEKFINRERLAQAYWTLYREAITRVSDKSISQEKKWMINYGFVRDEYLEDSQKKLIKEIDEENEKEKENNEVVFLAFDWFRDIVKGDVPPSVVDETSKKKKGVSKEKLDGKKGQLDAELKSAQLKIDKMEKHEIEIQKSSELIIEHDNHPDFENYDLRELYDSEKKDAVATILEASKELLKLDRQLASNYRVIERMIFEVEKMENAMEQGGNYIDISETVYAEFLSFRQMAKMSAGKQGNHFPLLYSGYMPQDKTNIGTISNVLKIMDEIEKLDPKLFYRTYKGEDHKIVPYVLVIPSYGDYGICWEPFSRSNRATSKGRVIIPMYPKSLKIALLTGLADLRWQIAKEKAQHYWMEEGLTGGYYEYYMNEKLKGNVKNHFINDYIKWINWESRGVQKLHKDARPVFWRHTPFPEEIREGLKNKGYYYNQLYKKDQNRSMSDGY